MKTADLEAMKQQLEAVSEHSKDAVATECPEFATYRIMGDDVPAVKLLFKELCSRYGEHNEPFTYLPLEIVMKTLVGSDAYMGYIQSFSEGEPCDILVEFHEAHRDCLKDALLEVFPNLTIEIIDQN